MSDTFWYSATAVLALLNGAVYVLMLVEEWRFSSRQVSALTTIILSLVGMLQVLHYIMLSHQRASMAATVMDAAIFLFLPLLSPWRRGRLLFVCASAYSFTFIVLLFADLLAPGVGPANFTARALLGCLGFVVLHRWYAPRLHELFHTPVGGWYTLSLVPLMFGIIFFLMSSVVIADNDTPTVTPLLSPKLFPGIPDFAVYITLLVLPLVIYTMFYCLSCDLLRNYTVSRDHTVLSAQLTAMAVHKGRVRRQERQEEQTLNRLRSSLAQVEAHIRQGEPEQALALVQQLEGNTSSVLGSPIFRRYTGDPVLNTVLGEYACMAEEYGISASFQFDLPPRPALNRTALAVVLSNALENAVHACRSQPEGRPREIRLFTHNTREQFFLQIENSCDQPVRFAPDTGLPLVRTEGHGYGTRSIAAFVRQHGGSLRLSWHTGTFQLQILI